MISLLLPRTVGSADSRTDLPGELYPEEQRCVMTHCAGYRAAAVALASDIRSLGIDAERHAPLPEGILDAIALPSERRRAEMAGERHWDRMLFSAKESVFKAWFPMTDREFGFEEADIEIHGGYDEEGTFTAHVLRSAPACRGTLPGGG
jgi:4'-phosphopantetheinyl transferase EntD